MAPTQSTYADAHGRSSEIDRLILWVERVLPGASRAQPDAAVIAGVAVLLAQLQERARQLLDARAVPGVESGNGSVSRTRQARAQVVAEAMAFIQRLGPMTEQQLRATCVETWRGWRDDAVLSREQAVASGLSARSSPTA